MSESTPFNVQAFQPYGGGLGKRLSATSISSRGAIPGFVPQENTRVLITNGGAVSACVRFGASTVEATADCMEILPGTTVLVTVPYSASELWIAAISPSGTTTVQATAGTGT